MFHKVEQARLAEEERAAKQREAVKPEVINLYLMVVVTDRDFEE